MNRLAGLLLLVVLPQEPFTGFLYCRDVPRGAYESQCVDLAPDGRGESRFKRRGSDEVRQSVALSPGARDRFAALVAATKNLAAAAAYESKRKVADLGRKRLVLRLPTGEERTAEFNYSDVKEVNALSTFFDALLNQQAMIFDLEAALRFERLTVPERLDQIERELKANRIADPAGLAAILEKIEQDDRVMNYAREQAREIRQRLKK
jgi:hypothetical protein